MTHHTWLTRSAIVSFGLFLIGWLSFPGQAQTRRAVLIGIDTYKPTSTQTNQRGGTRTWKNLEGAVNDVLTFKEILLAKYGFQPEHILVLKNQDATRTNILEGFQKQLIDEAHAGDVCVFYFAGHGSQVVNSKSTEPDLKDEALVPADSPQGAAYIRDKELARLYHKALDKKVLLTVIIDSCHSGSSSRGFPLRRTARTVEPELLDVAEKPDVGPSPEQRGALVLTAAQDLQESVEIEDDHGKTHGAFSWGLFQSLRHASVQESAEQIFSRAKAWIIAGGIMDQEPVLAGKTARLRTPLFGYQPRQTTSNFSIAVLGINGRDDVELQGGLAVGLSEGCLLARISQKSQPKLKLQVTSVTGINRCRAKIVTGSETSLQIGDLCEVEQWMLSPTEILRVWHPPATLPASSLVQIGKMMDELATRTQIRLVKDPVLENPTHTLNWTTSGWAVSGIDGTAQPLGTDLTIDGLKSALTGKDRQAQRLFINLPPSIEFSNRIQLGRGRRFNAVKITSDPISAQYVLLGRWHNQELQYAWALPNTNQSQKTPTTLPIITDWISFGALAESQQKAIAQLEQFALRIGKIRAWLTLESPPDSVLFPYHIALKNEQTGEVKRQGIVRKDEIYRFLLQSPEGIQSSNLVENRYVYLFLIDRNGTAVLLFPRPDLGNVENLVPYRTTSTALPPKEFLLGNKDDAVTIGEPFGTDTYVFLSSVVPLENPGLLESEGVRTERTIKSYSNPLEYVLANLGTATRGSTPAPLISDWSIERITLQSVNAK